MRRAALVLAALVLVAGCAPRTYHFKPPEVRKATKFLNRSGSEAKPYIEGVCSPTPTDATMKGFCRVTRALYKGVLHMADGIDEAMNDADTKNTQDIDLAKVIEAGFKILDLVTEEEATARVAGGR